MQESKGNDQEMGNFITYNGLYQWFNKMFEGIGRMFLVSVDLEINFIKVYGNQIDKFIYMAQSKADLLESRDKKNDLKIMISHARFLLEIYTIVTTNLDRCIQTDMNEYTDTQINKCTASFLELYDWYKSIIDNYGWMLLGFYSSSKEEIYQTLSELQMFCQCINFKHSQNISIIDDELRIFYDNIRILYNIGTCLAKEIEKNV